MCHERHIYHIDCFENACKFDKNKVLNCAYCRAEIILDLAYYYSLGLNLNAQEPQPSTPATALTDIEANGGEPI